MAYPLRSWTTDRRLLLRLLHVSTRTYGSSIAPRNERDLSRHYSSLRDHAKTFREHGRLTSKKCKELADAGMLLNLLECGSTTFFVENKSAKIFRSVLGVAGRAYVLLGPLAGLARLS